MVRNLYHPLPSSPKRLTLGISGAQTVIDKKLRDCASAACRSWAARERSLRPSSILFLEREMEKFAALIAIDWADRQHAVSLYDEGTSAYERAVVKHTPEALNDWARQRELGRYFLPVSA